MWWNGLSHYGRSFTGNRLEQLCPCDLEPCGLVSSDTIDKDCDQHGWGATKTLRQGHRAEDCPGATKLDEKES